MKKLIIIPIILTLIGGFVGGLTGWNTPEPVSREILIKARQYAYNPSTFKVNRGDTLHIKLVSMDVVHGFFVEGYDIDAEIHPNSKTFKTRHPSEGYNWIDTEDIVIIAEHLGKFRYRCSHTCGNLHPFMQGEMIVQPNTPYHISLGAIIGFFVGMIIMFALRISINNKTKTI